MSLFNISGLGLPADICLSDFAFTVTLGNTSLLSGSNTDYGPNSTTVYSRTLSWNKLPKIPETPVSQTDDFQIALRMG